MRKIMSIMLVLTLVVGVSSAALAWNGKGKVSGQRDELWEERLDLSEEEIERLSVIREEFWKEMEEIRDEFYQRQKELEDLYFDKDVSERKVSNLQGEIRRIKTKMTALRDEFRLQFRDTLNEEQLEKIERWRFTIRRSGRHGGRNSNSPCNFGGKGF